MWKRSLWLHVSNAAILWKYDQTNSQSTQHNTTQHKTRHFMNLVGEVLERAHGDALLGRVSGGAVVLRQVRHDHLLGARTFLSFGAQAHWLRIGYA